MIGQADRIACVINILAVDADFPDEKLVIQCTKGGWVVGNNASVVAEAIPVEDKPLVRLMILSVRSPRAWMEYGELLVCANPVEINKTVNGNVNHLRIKEKPFGLVILII